MKFKKVINFSMALLMLFSSMQVVYGKESSSLDEEIKEKAIKDKKVLNPKTYENIVKQSSDIEEINAKLDKYVVKEEVIYENSKSRTSNGKKRITKKYLYSYDNNLQSKSKIGSLNTLANIVLSFASLVPSTMQFKISLLAIATTILGIPKGEVTTTKSVSGKTKYDTILTIKTGEIYENGWIGKAQSREKKYSSYILASGYNKKGKHFSKTCELGTMKKQTGKYFSDSSLLARVRYGMQPTEIWDEHTGKTTYYKKTVNNCKIK